MKALRVCRLKQASLIAVAVGGIAALSACGAKQVAYVPPPPPPPVIVVIPPRPLPPFGVSPNLIPPPRDASGLYRSVNRNISLTQSVWNLRSAYNVAALNCRQPQHVTMIDSYREFLRLHAKALKKANKKVDAEFTALHGKGYIPYRETYMTEVYNHFALPPTMTEFCDAVAAVAREAQLIKPEELELLATRSLPTIEVVFDNFYSKMDVYRGELAAWEAKYGPPAPVAAPAVSAFAASPPPASGPLPGSLVVPAPAAPGTLVLPPPAPTSFPAPTAPGAISVTLPATASPASASATAVAGPPSATPR